jgi:hypothetical protein
MSDLSMLKEVYDGKYRLRNFTKDVSQYLRVNTKTQDIFGDKVINKMNAQEKRDYLRSLEVVLQANLPEKYMDIYYDVMNRKKGEKRSPHHNKKVRSRIEEKKKEPDEIDKELEEQGVDPEILEEGGSQENEDEKHNQSDEKEEKKEDPVDRAILDIFKKPQKPQDMDLLDILEEFKMEYSIDKGVLETKGDKEKAEKTIKKIDTNKDGKIDKDELSEARLVNGALISQFAPLFGAKLAYGSLKKPKLKRESANSRSNQVNLVRASLVSFHNDRTIFTEHD